MNGARPLTNVFAGNELSQKLFEIGITDTRHDTLRDALAACHKAFSAMDSANRTRCLIDLPFIAEAAQFYGANTNGTSTFDLSKV